MPAQKRKAVHSRLYELLGVTNDAAENEIRKAYRIRALATHPDKRPDDPNAATAFSELKRAFDILGDPQRRLKYDQNGDEDETSEAFETAYNLYRQLFPKINDEDIETFALRYRGSTMEDEDLTQFYIRNGGDVADLLEWIPLSEPEHVTRLVDRIRNLIKDGSLKKSAKFESSIKRLQSNAEKLAKKTRKEKSQAAKMKAESESALIEAIRSKRSTDGRSLIEMLEQKYTK